MIGSSLLSLSLLMAAGHVHGKATLQIAVEENGVVEFELESPADSIFGFEGKAKSPAQEAAKADAIEKIKKVSSWIQWADAKTCKEGIVEVEASGHGQHTDVEVSVKFDCGKTVPAAVDISLGKLFSRLETLDVEVVTGQKQSKTSLKSAAGRVSLK